MSASRQATSARPASGRAVERAVLPLFAGALLVSAFLLFGVQPMFAKMILPILGGAPGVWSVATVAFQSLLLAGYAYAHAIGRAPVRIGLPLHFALTAAAALTLPFAIGIGWRAAPPAGFEAIWLLGLLLTSIGLPFLALAASAPLLQSWFARTGHAAAQDPYFLYAASNVGSFAALAAYPLLIEPFLPLGDQSRAWALGFAGLSALLAGAGVLAMQGSTSEITSRRETVSPARVPWTTRLAWVGLAAVPSSLLVSVTAHLSTDIAALPLLWVVPLGLYLLSFVIAFRKQSRIAGLPWLGLLQVGGTAAVLCSLEAPSPLALALVLHLGVFAITALVCHRALFQRRPAASDLTDFYLSMAIGGALGGLFSAIVAPLLFSTVAEYPLGLVAALLCRPSAPSEAPETRRDLLAPTVFAVSGLALASCASRLGVSGEIVRPTLTIALIVLAVFSWRRRATSGLLLVALAIAVFLFPPGGRGETHRSFFGVHKIADTPDGRFRTLSHGTTIHGGVRIREDDGSPAAGRPEPTTYYGLDGNLGAAIAAVREARGGRLAAVTAVGLGTGSLACHRVEGERWTFLEIDEAVVRIARDPKLFGFLQACAPEAPIVLGDARLTLGGQPAGQDLLVLDAFSSDSIPLHLLTREAVALYGSKLATGGALLLHVSNRHLDLRRILATVGAAEGLTVFARIEKPDEPFEKRLRAGSIVVAMAREPANLGRLAADPSWVRLGPEPGRRPWTDDYSNVLEALLDRGRP